MKIYEFIIIYQAVNTSFTLNMSIINNDNITYLTHKKKNLIPSHIWNRKIWEIAFELCEKLYAAKAVLVETHI